VTRDSQPAGFTLIELVVALAITSLLALTAHALLAGVLDASDALRRSAPPQERGVLARAWLLEACRTLEVGTAASGGFEGNATSARFSARLPGEEGWITRRPVSVAASDRALTLSVGPIQVAPIDSADGVTLDYLVDGAGDGGWVSGWSSPVSAPLAIRVRWTTAEAADTLLCPIGPRG
jgi:prepilin-type N-terminal cleavage/methylation domain-containing protein